MIVKTVQWRHRRALIFKAFAGYGEWEILTMAEISEFFPKIINEINHDSIRKKNICLLSRAGTGNRVVWESIVSLDRLENFLSLGQTYSYRQFPVMIFFSVLNWMSNNLWTKFENCNHSAKGRGNIQEIVALCTNLSRISFHMLVRT